MGALSSLGGVDTAGGVAWDGAGRGDNGDDDGAAKVMMGWMWGVRLTK